MLFERLEDAVETIRVISQAGLYPSNVRLLDAAEAHLSGFGDGKSTIVVLAFENADHPVDPWMERAMEICGDHGGRPESGRRRRRRAHSGTAGAWRTAFIKMPISDPLWSLPYHPHPLKPPSPGTASQRSTALLWAPHAPR